MIPKHHRDNFDTLCHAFAAGHVCLLECRRAAGGKLAYVICAVNHDGGSFELVPFATFFDDNPYAVLEPPSGKEGS